MFGSDSEGGLLTVVAMHTKDIEGIKDWCGKEDAERTKRHDEQRKFSHEMRIYVIGALVSLVALWAWSGFKAEINQASPARAVEGTP